MRVPGRRLQTLTLAFVAGAVACVPRDDPPAGRHIVADRVSRPVGFVAPNGDGSTRVLVTRPGQSPYAVDLWVVTVDATGAPPIERLLVENVVASFGGSQTQVYGNGNCGGTDGRGRLLVGTNEDEGSLVRIDPVTGDRLDLGAVDSCLLSASGQRLLTVARQTAILYEPDDQVISLDASSSTFVGEDLYYVDTQGDLMRLPPDGPAMPVATNVAGLGPASPTDAGPTLLLARVNTTTPPVPSWSILDVSTGRETALPSLSAGFTMSSDGRWIETFDESTGAAAFVDARTGDEEPITVPDALLSQPTWRPGHDEAWFFRWSGQPSLSIRRPDGFALDLALAATDVEDNRGSDAIFTADGAWWFSSAMPLDASSNVMVGDADDPTGPRFQVAPPATIRGAYSLLADGQILTPTWTSSPERNNLYAVDPRTGDTRVLGEQGLLLAVGQTRLLVNQHIVEHEGDLTVVQLTGEQTVLAPEFTVTAAVAPMGADAVAPGAPVAFSFVARFPSDYDGVWLATVP